MTGPADALARINGLTFADVDIPDSALGQVTMDSLALGGTSINQLDTPLQSAIETQLHDWCVSVETSGDNSFCDGSAPGIGDFSLLQLGMIGAPVDTLQLGQTQLGHTQLGQTQLGQTQLGHTSFDDLSGSASGIVGMQLGHTDLDPGVGISGLLVSNLPTATQNALFYCSTPPSNFDCTDTVNSTLANAQAAGAIKPGTLVGDLDVGTFLDGTTIQDLLATVDGPTSAYENTLTFGDVVGLLMRSADVNWEGLSPDLLTIFDPNRQSMSMAAGFTVQGTGSPAADVKIDLPAGFDFVPGSAELIKGSSTAQLADPTITDSSPGPGIELDWQLAAVDAGQPYSIKFGAYPGTTVGPTQATEMVSAGGHSDSSISLVLGHRQQPGRQHGRERRDPDRHGAGARHRRARDAADGGRGRLLHLPDAGGGNAHLGAPDGSPGRLRPRALLSADDVRAHHVEPRAAAAGRRRPRHAGQPQRRLERTADALPASRTSRTRESRSCSSPTTGTRTTRTSAWSRRAAADRSRSRSSAITAHSAPTRTRCG